MLGPCGDGPAAQTLSFRCDAERMAAGNSVCDGTVALALHAGDVLLFSQRLGNRNCEVVGLIGKRR